MKIIGIIGTIIGIKPKLTMNYIDNLVSKNFSNTEIEILDLKDLNIVYSDGRNYRDYNGDTKYLVESIMSADIIIIGAPIFQASMPGVLKNVFDLLPSNAFKGKIVGIYVTAGTCKHFLMIEQHLKPILSFMQACIVPSYVFIESRDFYENKIINADVKFRLNKMVEEAVRVLEIQRSLDKKIKSNIF